MLRVIRHDRSAGQSTAIRTGVLAARGRWIATLDGDGQNDPSDIPALLDRGSELLISFKHGRSHAGDSGAVLDLLRFHVTTRKVESHHTLAAIDDKIMQMGEWVRFPNGDIASYIDAQQKSAVGGKGRYLRALP